MEARQPLPWCRALCVLEQWASFLPGCLCPGVADVPPLPRLAGHREHVSVIWVVIAAVAAAAVTVALVLGWPLARHITSAVLALGMFAALFGVFDYPWPEKWLYILTFVS